MLGGALLRLDELNYQRCYQKHINHSETGPIVYGPRSAYYKYGSGVLDLLGQLCSDSTISSLRLIVPSDVYPRYFEVIPKSKILMTIEANGEWVSQLPSENHCALLLPNPIVPKGIYLNVNELMRINLWLQSKPERWLILDCVYDFGLLAYSSTQAYLKSKKVIYLNSDSKRFGMSKKRGWASCFIHLPGFSPGSEEAATDTFMLQRYFSSAWNKVLACCPQLSFVAPNVGYLSLVEEDFRVLRDSYNIAAVPFSVFGGDAKSSVLSCLSLLGR